MAFLPPFFRLHRRQLQALGVSLLLTGWLSISALAQTPVEGAYSRARIWLGPQGLSELAKLGVAVDHGESKTGVWFESDFSAAELATMRAAGRRCDILIADVQAHYVAQNQAAPAARTQSGLVCDPPPAYPAPSTFRLGSMGGYFTYDEVLQKLDSMRLQWPNLISLKAPTGPLRSVEGRPLYWVRISDNPDVNESEPEMLYNGLHHAREPMSVASLLYYMYYLLESYATNPDVRAIVDNTELYFLPCVNPDGYIFNETSNPQGGGMWRKNRRDNQNGSFGIDLNRNYGSNWGYDDLGSSPNSFSDVFRGPSAFSEPETQAVRDFSLQHSFQLVLNYHSSGNVFIYPYGYEPNVYTPDSAQFADYGRWLTRADHYTFGTCNQVLGYITNGDANDWQYSVAQGPKPQAFSFTPEIGYAHEGFWPPINRIQSLCHDNLTRNLDAARLLLADAVLTDASPRFFPQRTAYVRYSLKQLGLKTPGNYTVTVTPLPGAGTAGPAKSYTLTSVRQEQPDSIALTLPAAITSGQSFRYVLSVNNGLYSRRDTLTKVFGTPAVAFASDGNSLTGWDSPTGWGVENTVYHTPPASLADSPGGVYFDNLANDVFTLQPIDLRGASHAELTFWARWEIETRFDYGQVMVSTDNGTTWQPLCGRYSRPGNAFQRFGEPIYDGFQLNWVREQMSLDEFTGQQIWLGFRLGADSQNAFDGLFIDDVRVERLGGLTGLTPEAPALLLSAVPNPARDAVTITAGQLPASGGVLRVRDALGRVVAEGALTPGTEPAQRLDVRAWPAGLYAATVEAAGRRPVSVRFVVAGQ